MADNQDITLKIRILDAQGNFFGGTVDVRCEHTRLSERPEYRDADASRVIDVRGLRRAPEGMYKVFVTLSDPWRQEGKFVNIPPSGLATLDFVFERAEEPEGPEPPGEQFEVRGLVRHPDARPAPDLRIQAFDRDLRSEELLGEARTDRGGAYRIGYSASQIRKRERGAADLVVKAIGADGALLVASPVTFNAPPRAEIDLKIPRGRGPALFDRIAAAIEPLLGDVGVEDLEENQEHQDLTFLSGETGFGRRDLARFALSHHLVHLGIRTEFWFALLASSVFNYSETRSLEDHRTAVTAALGTLDAPAVRRALDRAFAVQDIAAALAEKNDEWIEAFLELISGLALGDPDNPTFLKLALDDAGIEDAERQAHFARLFNRYRTLGPELIAELEKDPSFEAAEIADLRTSYRLAELTRGDFSVVRALKTELDVRRPEQIRTLAKRSEEQWIEWTKRKHQAGEIELPLRFGSEEVGPLALPEAEIYGRVLERQLREAFPTAAFTGGLERALAGDGPRGLRRGRDLGAFLERHPDFELHRTRVDQFLDNGVEPDLRHLAQDQDFRLELMGVQRVFKLAPIFETTDTLLADGLHSAQGVYRMGESAFVERYSQSRGFTADRARLAWNRAADTYAAVVTIVGDLKAREKGCLPAVLASGGEGALADFPNWENLFRGGDVCHCEHCRSVLGPAAYFADLLMFLGDRETVEPPAENVRDVLFTRRPDLGYLELGCDNAHTTLPYVDVVCEVLERAIADGESDVELPGLTAIPDDSEATRAAVTSALTGEGLSPGNEVSLSQVKPDPNLWVMHGDEATYLLKKPGTANFFAEVLPNAKASSEELRAYPAYVNTVAYTKLQEAGFPFSLPFDLFAEEVRAGFQKSNIQRWDLMRTLRGSDAPNNPTDAEIAAEYFAISISSDPNAAFDEKCLILNEDITAAGQKLRWGETGTTEWLEELSDVKTFLGKTGLEYEELLALLDLPFLNPTGKLFIEHLDSSCDTAQKRLRGLDAEDPKRLSGLDRIHRFLRLWRKLDGWKLWELDLVIRDPAIGARTVEAGALDEDFLIALYFFSRLRNRLGAKVTVEQVCALMGDLNTETHFVATHEKRGDGLYQSLFLNRRLIQPLDPAFEVDAITADPPPEKLKKHLPVILAALKTRETDLDLLTRASDETAYITDDLDLTLANLSFLWRRAWLSKHLKLDAAEWKSLLKLRPGSRGAPGPEVPRPGVHRAARQPACGLQRPARSGAALEGRLRCRGTGPPRGGHSVASREGGSGRALGRRGLPDGCRHPLHRAQNRRLRPRSAVVGSRRPALPAARSGRSHPGQPEGQPRDGDK